MSEDQGGGNGGFDPQALKNDILSANKQMIESAMESLTSKFSSLIESKVSNGNRQSATQDQSDFGDDILALTDKIDISTDGAKALLNSSASYAEKKLLGKVVTKSDIEELKSQWMNEVKASLSENITKDVLTMTELNNKRAENFRVAQQLYPDLMDKNSEFYNEAVKVYKETFGDDSVDPAAVLKSAKIAASNLGISARNLSSNPRLTNSISYSPENQRASKAEEIQRTRLAEFLGVDPKKVKENLDLMQRQR
jgi:hypothetical protein